MVLDYTIRSLEEYDIEKVIYWSRNEGFAPGYGDVGIYKNTDKQGLWIGALDSRPIGCIAGVKYNPDYGFIGLFIVDKVFRGKGFGLKLWEHVINKLDDVPCLGIEAATDRISDYQKWGFKPSSITTRWRIIKHEGSSIFDKVKQLTDKFCILDGSQISPEIIQLYDEKKEDSPRPHFLSDWLSHKEGSVRAILDESGSCVAFCRLRPCLLKKGSGYRIGPLIAESPLLASLLLCNIISNYNGVILIDSPGINVQANILFRSMGFNSISHTIRMYKGTQPSISMKDVYGLACLELG